MPESRLNEEFPWYPVLPSWPDPLHDIATAELFRTVAVFQPKR